jgi:hypothetical protein
VNDELSFRTAKVITRRSFAQSALIAAVAVSAPGAQTEEIGIADMAGLSKIDWAEVQARLGNLVRVYGSRLSEPERLHCLQILIANQHMLASIRSFLVQNGDAAALSLRLLP